MQEPHQLGLATMALDPARIALISEIAALPTSVELRHVDPLCDELIGLARALLEVYTSLCEDDDE
jgi:hypothetical protein